MTAVPERDDTAGGGLLDAGADDPPPESEVDVPPESEVEDPPEVDVEPSGLELDSLDDSVAEELLLSSDASDSESIE